jgi:hypothetical protein
MPRGVLLNDVKIKKMPPTSDYTKNARKKREALKNLDWIVKMR